MKPRSAGVTPSRPAGASGDQQLQRVGSGAAGADQQLDDRVDRRRVGGLEVDHRQHRGQLVAEQLRAHRPFARPHPVAVAGQRVDLAVVGDHPVGVGELPAGEGVGGEARVHQRQRRLGALVAELGEEVLELGRAQHPLVDEGAGGEGDDLQLAAGALLGRAADDVEAPLERLGVTVEAVGGDRQPADHRHAVAGHVAEAVGVDRHVVPAEDPQPAALAGFLDDALRAPRGGPGRGAGSTSRSRSGRAPAARARSSAAAGRGAAA